MSIDLLKNQHITIRQLVREIEERIYSGDLTVQAFDISLKIGQLSGLLLLHLKSEDEVLYPSLMHSTDEKTRNLSQEFNRDMGSLAGDFMEYKRTYMLASRIKSEPQKFKLESQTIIAALKNRLDKEDRYLYPLV